MKIPFAKITIRFRDIDVMGHVNNAVYLSYFEQTRIHYFKYLLGRDWDWQKDGIILLKNEIEYLKPLKLGDDPEIEMKVDKIGTKSFILSYFVWLNEECYCKGKSVLVGYHNEDQCSIPIPEKMKEGLMLLQKEQ